MFSFYSGDDVRKRLKQINGQRLRFSATVVRFGTKSAYKGDPLPTILLKDVKRLGTDDVLTDHLWFTKGKSWDRARINSEVEFDAGVSVYEKGYQGRRDDVYDSLIQEDYRLKRPTKEKVL